MLAAAFLKIDILFHWECEFFCPVELCLFDITWGDFPKDESIHVGVEILWRHLSPMTKGFSTPCASLCLLHDRYC